MTFQEMKLKTIAKYSTGGTREVPRPLIDLVPTMAQVRSSLRAGVAQLREQHNLLPGLWLQVHWLDFAEL